MKHFQLVLLGSIIFTTPFSPSLSSAKISEKLQPQANTRDSLISLEQSDADKQREAERTSKERQDQDRYRNPGSNPFPTYTPYGAPPGSPFGNQGYPYQSPGTVIQSPPNPPGSRTEGTSDRQPEQSNQELNPNRRDQGTASVSLGFKNGTINPSLGYRFGGSPIGVELGAIFNQDTLPDGRLNESSNLLQQFPNGFTNLGRKSLSPQVGADLLGYFNVAPNVSLYGGVGLYIQSQSTIIRSNVSNDLFKDASSVGVSVAASGGVDVKVSDALRFGGGYHSLRGVTAKIGYDF